MERKMENDTTNAEGKGKMSSLKSAKKRAEEIRKHLGGDLDEGVDDFFVDPNSIPEGWTYEWKRHTVLGMEDPTYQVALRRTGWAPVPAARHPEMMPVGHKDDTILRKGMILMERPEEITQEVRSIDKKRARDQVRVKEQQLSEAPNGQFERKNKDSSLAKVKKSFEAMPIPEE
jgi:hypothetical protein